MSDENLNPDPAAENAGTPGVPMTNGVPHPGENTVAGPGETQDPAETAQEGAGEAFDFDGANVPKPVGKLVERREIKYSGPEAKQMAEKALTKAEIGYLRVLCVRDDLTIELPGNSNMVDDAARALVIPGLFGTKGARSKDELMEVIRVPDGLGGIARTVVKLKRTFADKVYVGASQ